MTTSQRARYVEELDAAIGDLTEQLAHLPEVRKVVLFGSAAAGRRDMSTDLDLLVIMDSDLDFVTRSAELAGRLRCWVALDLLLRAQVSGGDDGSAAASSNAGDAGGVGSPAAPA
ncbi:MAG: nucleotidyltransferase domain-containing protein [Candidatus Latescibacterota bacterium]